jgi:hypothetical protein
MSNVIRLGANFDEPMTVGQGFDEIESIRRQLDRLEHLPAKEGAAPIDPEKATQIRDMLAHAEASIREFLSQDN